MAGMKYALVGGIGSLRGAFNIAGTAANMVLDAEGDKVGWVFQAPEAIVITRIGIRHAVIAGTPPTYKLGLQGVAVATGDPDGTYLGGASPASATFTPSAGGGYGAGTWHWITLANAYTCARGEVMSIVIEWSSGTVDASNCSSFTYGRSGDSPRPGLPYTELNTGTWAADANLPMFAYGSATVAYGMPWKAYSAITISTTTEGGLRFSLDSGWGSTYKLLGVRWALGTVAAGTVYQTLYSGGTSAPTILQQVAIDSDISFGASTIRDYTLYFDEETLTELSFGTEYHVGLVCSANTTTLSYLEVEANADFDAYPWGKEFYWAQRALTDTPPSANDTNVFTNTDTKRPVCELILADWTEPAASGGGLLTHPGMSGGMRG